MKTKYHIKIASRFLRIDNYNVSKLGKISVNDD